LALAVARLAKVNFIVFERSPAGAQHAHAAGAAQNAAEASRSTSHTSSRVGAAGADHRVTGNGLFEQKLQHTPYVSTALKPESKMRMQMHHLPAAATFMIRHGPITRSSGTCQHCRDDRQRWHRIRVIKTSTSTLVIALGSLGQWHTSCSHSDDGPSAAPSADLATLQMAARRGLARQQRARRSVQRGGNSAATTFCRQWRRVVAPNSRHWTRRLRHDASRRSCPLCGK
jgi:hypothetical protein